MQQERSICFLNRPPGWRQTTSSFSPVNRTTQLPDAGNPGPDLYSRPATTRTHKVTLGVKSAEPPALLLFDRFCLTNIVFEVVCLPSRSSTSSVKPPLNERHVSMCSTDGNPYSAGRCNGFLGSNPPYRSPRTTLQTTFYSGGCSTETETFPSQFQLAQHV